MSGKYQKGDRTWETPYSGKRTRGSGRGGGSRVGVTGWWALRGHLMGWTLGVMLYVGKLNSNKKIKIKNKKDFIYLFERESIGEWGREEQKKREKQTSCWAGNLMQGWIPGLWDHDLSWRQTLSWLNYPGNPLFQYFFLFFPLSEFIP